MNKSNCRVCGNSELNIEYIAREMLHGTKEEFEYFQCNNCGCVQIAAVPDNLARYYPSEYQAHKNYARKAHNKLRHFLDSRRVRFGLTGRGLLGRLLAGLHPLPDYVHWCKVTGVRQESKVLDIGCGTGKLISRMLAGGFSHLCGIDLYIPGNINFGRNAHIYKRDIPTHIAQSEEKYDLIMMHHSLEHMDNQEQVLNWCSKLLADDGWLLIRIPLADSNAWDAYRQNWFGLDPPRHLYLHTSKSMRMLVERCGMVVCAEERDSIATQFTYSELYKRGIPANAPHAMRDIFTNSQIKEYSKQSQWANVNGRGDQGVFYIRKVILTNGTQTDCS